MRFVPQRILLGLQNIYRISLCDAQCVELTRAQDNDAICASVWSTGIGLRFISSWTPKGRDEMPLNLIIACRNP